MNYTEYLTQEVQVGLRFTSIINFVYQIQFVYLLSSLNWKPSNYFMSHWVYPKSPANNRAILQGYSSRKRNFNVKQMEYKILFDKVACRWVISSLQFIGTNNKTVPVTKKNKIYWTKNAHRYRNNKLIKREDTEIQK